MTRMVTRPAPPALTCANLLNNLINYEQSQPEDARVILTVTLNPAVDVTYQVDRLVPRSAARVASARQRAGGKGVNVARVAAACGADVCATGLAGGARGELIVAWLTRQGMRADFEPIAGESRQTLTIVETGRGSAGRGGAAGHPTELREIGPVVTPGEWSRFRKRFGVLVAEAGVVVLSGSLPPGVPEDAYATLTEPARAAGTPVIVDTGGAALRLASAAGPDIVKPNEGELLAAAGPGGEGTNRTGRLLTAAAALRELGAASVVVSLARSGSLAVTPAGRWRVSHERVHGNPVGAGDAFVAGLAVRALGGAAEAGGIRGWGPRQWRPALVMASGLAMSSVLSECAGEADPGPAAALSEKVRVRTLGGEQP